MALTCDFNSVFFKGKHTFRKNFNLYLGVFGKMSWGGGGLETSLGKDLFDSLRIFGKYFIRFLEFLEMGMDFSKRSSNGLLWKTFLEKFYRLLEKDLLGKKCLTQPVQWDFSPKIKRKTNV